MATRYGGAPSPSTPAGHPSNYPGYVPLGAPSGGAAHAAAAAAAARPGYMRLNSEAPTQNSSANSTPLSMPQPLPSTANGSSGSRAPSRNGGGGGSKSKDRKDTKEIAWVHWRALRDFLAAWGEKESPTARASAREKLTRLTRLQFLELSTDVYDELMRRLSVERGSPDHAAPFLPGRDDFHPKRNQARQKLATLPKTRFKDLGSDVFFELRRRYPEFEQLDVPAPAPSLRVGEPVQAHQPQLQHSPPQLHQHADPYDEPPAPGPIPLYQNQSSAAAPVASGHRQSPSVSMGHRNTPSQSSTRNTPGGAESSRQGHHRKGSSMGSSLSQGGAMERVRTPTNAGGNLANLTAATNDVVVPNKSRLQEEEIEVPYARDSIMDAAEGPTVAMPGPSFHMREGLGPSALSQPAPMHLRAESRASEPTHDSPARSDDTHSQYLDRMSFASNQTSTRGGKPIPASGGPASPNGWDHQEQEKLRAEYELRIASLERRAQIAEAERDEAARQASEERERRKDYEDEVRGLKERATTHASSLRSIQHELNMSQDAAEAIQQQAEQTARQAQEELAQWRERCEGLEDELRRLEDERSDRATRDAALIGAAAAGSNGVDNAMASELQAEMKTLVKELQAVSLRNDELVGERERDNELMEALRIKVEEHKKQADKARIELRNLKATSTLFVSQPLTEDHLPASPDGNIADMHVAAFQNAIDGVLGAARSSHPSGVLPAMKAIVEAVSDIGEDVKNFEESPNIDVDASRLESLKYESTARLGALMNVARNHAMASGLSPVSLIDAAAGHVSANVVEIIKLLKIRRTGSTRDILQKPMGLSFGEMVRRRSLKPSSSEGGHDSRAASAAAGGDDEDDSIPLMPSPDSSDAGGPSAHGRADSRSIDSRSAMHHTAVYSAPSTNAHPATTPSPAPAASSLPASRSPPQTTPLTHHPPSSYEAPVPTFRINSFQSASSTAQRSDSFDLERKGSTASAASGSEYGSHSRFLERKRSSGNERDRPDPFGRAPPLPAGPTPPSQFSPPAHPGNPFLQQQQQQQQQLLLHQQLQQAQAAQAQQQQQGPNPFVPPGHARNMSINHSRTASLASVASGGQASMIDQGYARYGGPAPPLPVTDEGPTDQEWQSIKPYIDLQSSSLVNAIQNLLTAIRTGGQGPALNEHLSEVIATASSIVGVCTSALPESLRAQGDPLLAELIGNTDRLGEAQETAGVAGGFDKALRQGIASASFGVAKALKALNRLGED